MSKFQVNNVIQFINNHKWHGCLGIIDTVSKDYYLIKIPMPERGSVYITDSGYHLKYIGTVYEV